MRGLLCVLVAAGCYGDGESIQLSISDGPPRCHAFECPLALGATQTIAVGLQISDVVLADDRFVVEVEPPELVDLERLPFTVRVTARAPGCATLRVYHEYHQLIGQAELRVEPVVTSTILVDATRAGIDPGDQLLALHGSRVALRTEHFDAHGAFLGGLGLDRWALRGTISGELVGQAGARTQQLITRDAESFQLDIGSVTLPIIVVEPSQVRRLSLVNVEGRAATVAAGETARVLERYNARFHIAAYDATGAYVAGGGRPGELDVTGTGIRSFDASGRTLALEIVDAELAVRLGAVFARFGVAYP